MPQKPLRPVDPRSLAGFRDQFVRATNATIVPTRLGDVRISNLPLLRERAGDRDGGLEQVIRARIPAGLAAERITVRILDAGEPLAEATTTIARSPESLHLFVPEVAAPRLLDVELRIGDTLLGVARHEVTPQRKFTVHVVHHSHYDIGYTDPQSTVLEAQLNFIDYALELATLTDDWPDDARFRWNIEVNWPLKQWLRTRPKHARDALLRRVREGRFEVHALPFSMHTEAYSMDELAQQLAFTRELREQWGIDIVSAMQTDVPGITVGLASLLTDADIRYLAVAHNYAGISTPFLNDGQKLKRPFWWQAPDGERLLVWYTDTLIGDAYMEAMHVGFGSGYEDALGSLPEYLNSVIENGYPYGQNQTWMNLSINGVEITKQPYEYDVLHLRVHGAYADNASSSIVPATIIKEWNEHWAWPKLRSSIDRDFFTEVEARFGRDLDVYAGDWTDWWALGIGSAAFALGRNRQSQSDLRTAQTLHALADTLTDEPSCTVNDDARAAYEEMALFDEHTWGAADPWGLAASRTASGAYQWTRKEAFAYTAEERTQTLLNSGLQRLAPLAARSVMSPREETLLVFNPSSWPRTDLAKVFIPRHEPRNIDFDLIDLTTGTSVPAIYEEPENPNHRPIGRWIRFVARDVPAIGYRRYALVPSATARPPAESIPDLTTIAHDRLRVSVDPATASIGSIRDRATGRELVASDAPFGFNRAIYDRYTSAPGFNHLSSRIGGNAGSWLLGSRKSGEYGLVTAREANDVWDRLTLRYACDGAEWAEMTLTLPHGTARLHIQNRFVKPITMQKESLYYAFPFDVDDASISQEITGGVVGPDSPHVPGSLDHYRTLAHWATITSETTAPIAWATNEAPLVQIGNIHLPYAPFPKTLPEWDAHPATIYSWALNNIWDTNFPPEQGGELSFGYAVAVGDDDHLALGRDTGASVATPLVGFCAPVGVAPGSLPESGSFVRLDHPAVQITHLAPSRDGSGIAVFLYSLASEPVRVDLEVDHLPVTAARAGTFLETDFSALEIANGRIAVEIAAGEFKAVVLTVR